MNNKRDTIIIGKSNYIEFQETRHLYYDTHMVAFTDVYCTYLLYFYYYFTFKVNYNYIVSHNPNYWVVCFIYFIVLCFTRWQCCTG